MIGQARGGNQQLQRALEERGVDWRAAGTTAGTSTSDAKTLREQQAEWNRVTGGEPAKPGAKGYVQRTGRPIKPPPGTEKFAARGNVYVEKIESSGFATGEGTWIQIPKGLPKGTKPIGDGQWELPDGTVIRKKGS